MSNENNTKATDLTKEQLEFDKNKAMMAAASKLAGTLDQSTTAGGVGAGATEGASLGMMTGNPLVGAIGGVVGGVAGGLSAEAKREQMNREIDAQEIRDKNAAEQQRGMSERQTLSGLAARLSQTLLS